MPVAQVEEDEPIAERVLDDGAAADLNVERAAQHTAAGACELVRGDVSIVHQEVDLLLWMLCLENDLGAR